MNINETSGIVTKSSVVNHQFSINISGSTSTTTNTVCSVYMIIGPASCLTADRSLVARAIKSPVRCSWKNESG